MDAKLQFNEIEVKKKGFTRESLELVATTIDFKKDPRDIVIVESQLLDCHLIFKKQDETIYVEIAEGNAYLHKGITSQLKKW